MKSCSGVCTNAKLLKKAAGSAWCANTVFEGTTSQQPPFVKRSKVANRFPIGHILICAKATNRPPTAVTVKSLGREFFEFLKFTD